MNYTKYNPRCNIRTKWSCGDDGAVGEDDVDDDPDEARDHDDDDGDDLPSPGRNFPDNFLPAGELFLSLVSTPVVATEYFFVVSPRCFWVIGVLYAKGGSRRRPRATRWAPGAVQWWTAARWRMAPWWLPSAPSSDAKWTYQLPQA